MGRFSRHRRLKDFTEESLIRGAESRGGYRFVRREVHAGPKGHAVRYFYFHRAGSDCEWYVRVTHNGWVSEGFSLITGTV